MKFSYMDSSLRDSDYDMSIFSVLLLKTTSYTAGTTFFLSFTIHHVKLRYETATQQGRCSDAVVMTSSAVIAGRRGVPIRGTAAEAVLLGKEEVWVLVCHKEGSMG